MQNTQISRLIDLIEEFRTERDWKQFHTPKDLALSLAVEAAEVLERFQWKDGDRLERYLNEGGGREKVGAELADVFIYLLYLANDLDIDIDRAVRDKVRHNAEKYPVSKAKGVSTKYNEF
jgi:dCTP diphosphatase